MITKRPAAISGAVALLAFSGLANLLAAALPDEGPDPGPVVVIGVPLIGALALVAAVGLWRITTWSRLLAIVVSAFSVSLGLGGAIYATSPLVKGLGLALVISGAMVIALVMVPSARQTYAAAR